MRLAKGLVGGKLMKLYHIGEMAQIFDAHPKTIRKW